LNFLNFDLKKLAILAALVAFPLFSVNMQKYSPDRPWILEPFFYLAGFTQNVSAGFSSGVRQTTDLYLNLIDIKKSNRLLNEEITELRAQLGAMSELKLENERLSRLLEFRQKTNVQLLAAKIIGRDLLPNYHTVMIDRGESHGVKKGMATITMNGTVGYVVESKANASQILLLTDRYAAIDGIVQRSRVRTIVQGNGGEDCSLTHLNRDDDIVAGDLIVTSGLDNVFPKGFPIAKVKSVEKEQYGLGQNVLLTPVINANNLEELFVVIDAKNQDLEKLTTDAAAAPAPDLANGANNAAANAKPKEP
jgi:rod shape-determining protein MreC